MALARIAIALVLVAIFMFTGSVALDSAFQDSGQEDVITGETVNTGSIGTIEALDKSNIASAFYTQRPEITNGTGTLMTEGVDYTWFTNNGTFRIDSSDLANDNGVTVDYSYRIPQQEQSKLATFYGNYIDALAPLSLLFLAVTLIVGAMMRLGDVS